MRAQLGRSREKLRANASNEEKLYDAAVEMDELEQLKEWVKAHGTPQQVVCAV